MHIIEIDVSELPAPEPFEVIMDALLSLDKQHYLRVSHRKQPLLLYKPLEENNFDFHVQKGEVQAFDIFIWHKGETPPAGLVQPSIADTRKPPDDCCKC